MRIVMKKTVITTFGKLEEGVEYELFDAYAMNLITAGFAALLEKKAEGGDENGGQGATVSGNSRRGKKASQG